MRYTILLTLCLIASAAPADDAPSPRREARRNEVVRALEKAGPAVVNISTEQIVVRRDPFHRFTDRFFEDVFRFPFEQHVPVRSLGSGVVIDPRGYILTNEHVVRRASKITISLPDERTFEARRISEAPRYDLALLKIDAGEPLPFLPIGDSSDAMIGETIIAVGNPFGYQSSVTAGVLSAMNRTIHHEGEAVYTDLLQIDGSINPGNSGGPLLNALGELIGINTAIRAQAQGIGFAIPAHRIRALLPELFDFRRQKRIDLGCVLEEIVSDGNGLALRYTVRVASVEPGGPAAKAGLAEGDVVVVDGPGGATGLAALLAAVYESQPGDTLRLTVRRGPQHEARNIALTLGKLVPPDANELLTKRFGMTAQPLDGELAEQFRVEPHIGVLIAGVRPGSPAATARLGSGDVLVFVGDARIRTLDDLSAALEPLREGQRVRILVLRGRTIYSVFLTAEGG